MRLWLLLDSLVRSRGQFQTEQNNQQRLDYCKQGTGDILMRVK